MAKPLGPKSALIREAINANPGVGNTELAEMLNDAKERADDKLEIKAADVAAQRQALKQAAEAAPAAGKSAAKAGGSAKKAGPKAVSVSANGAMTRAAPAGPAARAGAVDLIDRTLDLAEECGGLAALKRLVDRLAEAQAR